MAFVPTTWVDGSAPAITAAQMNRIETGIDDAHKLTYSGRVSNTGTGTGLPSGWSSSLSGTLYTVTHTLGSASYEVAITAISGATFRVFTLSSVGSSSFTFYAWDSSGTITTSGFTASFIVRSRV